MNISLGRAVLELLTEDAGFVGPLKGAKEQLGVFKKEAQSLTDSLKSFGKSSTDLGKSLSTGLTAPIVAVGAGLAALVVTSANAGDEIAKNARTAGVSAESYQELAFAIGQVSDISDDELTKGMSKVTTLIGDAAAGNKLATETFKQLGFSQKEIAAGTITTEAAMNKLIAAMQNSRSAGEAAALAGNLVGDRLGPRLAGALRASGGEVDALRGQFRALGLGMSNEAVAASEKFNDELDVLTREVTALGREIASEFMPVFTGTLVPVFRDSVVPILRQIAEGLALAARWFSDLPAPVQTTAIAVLGVTAAVGPMLLVVGKVATTISTTIPLLAGMSGALTLVGQAAALVGTAFAGWEIGTWIGDISGLTDWIGKKLAGALYGVSEAEYDATNARRKAIEASQQQTGAIADLDAIQRTITDTTRGLAAATTAATTPVKDLGKAAKEAAERELKQLQDGLTSLGLTTKGEVNRALEEFAALERRATAEGIPMDRFLAAVLPKLEALSARAKASGLEVSDLTESLAEAKDTLKALAGAPPILPVNQLGDANQVLQRIRRSLTSVSSNQLQAARDTSILTNAYRTLGITSRAELQQIAANTRQAYADIVASGTATADQLEIAWGRVVEAEIAAGERTSATADQISGYFDGMGQAVLGHVQGLISGITEKWGVIGDVLNVPLRHAVDELSKQLDGWIQSVTSHIGSWVTSLGSSIASFFASLGSSVGSFLAGLGPLAVPAFIIWRGLSPLEPGNSQRFPEQDEGLEIDPDTGEPIPPPEFARGSGLNFMNFGRGTRSILHGDEAVVRRADGPDLADEVARHLLGRREWGAPGGQVVIKMDARGAVLPDQRSIDKFWRRTAYGLPLYARSIGVAR